MLNFVSEIKDTTWIYKNFVIDRTKLNLKE